MLKGKLDVQTRDSARSVKSKMGWLKDLSEKLPFFGGAAEEVWTRRPRVGDKMKR